MEYKTKTPFITVLLYLLGIIMLFVSAFMLYAALTYTKTYLASYDASFMDMMPNSLQYIISEFVPYLVMALLAFGVGKAAKNGNLKKAKKKDGWSDDEEVEVEVAQEDNSIQDIKASIGELGENLANVATNLEEFKITTAIKMEEQEKRDAYRIEDSRKQLEALIGEGGNDAAADEYVCKPSRPRRFIK